MISAIGTMIGEPLAVLRREQAARIATTAYVLLFLWGRHGNVELLGLVWPEWRGLSSQVGWGQQLLAFLIGTCLLVAVPLAITRSPRTFGLAGPTDKRFAIESTLVLAVVAVPAMVLASKDHAMRATYPFFRQFASLGDFGAYELSYFFFFLAIEFVFRGYLLLGLEPALGKSTIMVSALTYTVWHHGKPLQELVGTLFWGLVTGAMVLRMRSIWPVLLVHWGMNVLLDYLIWRS